MRRAGTALAVSLALSGCGGALVRLAKDQDWVELDRRARAQKHPPRGKAARAWAQALVELDQAEEARALLLRDFRHGGQERSLLALADLERRLGLRGIAAAHYTRLINIDLDTVRRSPEVTAICDLLRERARVEVELGEALAADADMRRVALACPSQISEDDRGFMAGLQAPAQAQARGQRSLPTELAPTPDAITTLQSRLDEQLELARKRSPKAMIAAAQTLGIELEPEDIAALLAAEFAGALGPGMITTRQLSAWIGNNDVAAVMVAIDGLPDGVREYGLLRLSSVRPSDRLTSEAQAWIVTAMDSVRGQGPHEAAKAWRVAAAVEDASAAELALNTNLRDMIPAVEPQSGVVQPTSHWSRRVPVERRSFDLLLTLARLFELREQPVLALELRRSVIVAGYEVGLAQVGSAAAEEVLRQLVLGHPWQALAVAEIVPGPLIDEVLPALASTLALARAAGLDEAIAADRNVVWRALGDAWFEAWDPRLEAAMSGLDLGEDTAPQAKESGALSRPESHALPAPRRGCPEIGQWLAPDPFRLARVGLDPIASRAALEAALAQPQAPATGVALVRALEADLGLACSAPLVNLLHAGSHLLALEILDERLVHAPELSAALQLQLQAEIAAAHGAGGRATLLTTSAAAESVDPRALWARAATAGRSFGVREYTLEALRQVILHSDGLDDPAARRELLLIRVRDVDGDEVLREGDVKAVEAIREAIRSYLREAPESRRWSRLDDLLWALAREQRADALAWTRLLEILAPILDEGTTARHLGAVAALTRASGQPSEAASANATQRPELVWLGDAHAICELELADLERSRLLGVATACDPRARAEALAALVEATATEARATLRARILDGPIAAEIDPERPGVLRSVPTLTRAGSSLRVAFNLPLDPLWISSE